MSKKLFHVTTTDKFFMRYAVMADNAVEAAELVKENPECYDYHQEFLGVTINNVEEITEERYFELFDKFASPGQVAWDKELKLKHVYGYKAEVPTTTSAESPLWAPGAVYRNPNL